MLGQDNNALMAQLLRQKQEQEHLAKRAGTQANTYRNTSAQMNPQFVVGGASQSMGGQPAPVALDWGSILGTGVSNFMAARKDKQAEEAERRAEELSQQFVMEAVGSDPELGRLMQMAQAGVPGADKAVAERISPRRQPLATFTQFISQNPELDDESAVAMGAEAGLSPQLSVGIRDAARKSRQYGEQQTLGKEQRDLEGQLLRDENNAILRQQYAQPPRSATSSGTGLTPGEKQGRMRMMAEADKELMDLGKSMGKVPELMSTIERDDVFGAESKTSQFLAESPNRLLAAIGRSNLAEGSLMLKEYMNSEVLTRMKALGGNDSNEELRTITASLPDAMNNKEAAMAMLKNIQNWQETVNLAVKLRRDDIQSGRWFGKEPTREHYYQQAKAMRQGGQQGFPQPAPSAPLSGIPTEQLNGIEGLLDELGIQ